MRNNSPTSRIPRLPGWKPTHHRLPLQLERLENRTTPAYMLTLDGAALTVNADVGDASDLSIAYDVSMDQYTVADDNGLVFNDDGSAAAAIVAGAGTAQIVLDGSLIDAFTFNLDDLGDRVTVNSNTSDATAPIDLNLGDGDDSVLFLDAATLSGGSIDGQAGTDLVNYQAYTTDVAVNLGTTNLFEATLDGAQEVPPNMTTATGSAFLMQRPDDMGDDPFDIAIEVDGITLDELTLAHLHVGPPGMNGPIIFNLGEPGAFPDFWTGLTGSEQIAYDQAGVGTTAMIPEANEADLLAGNVYINIHTMEFPGGEIRGQLLLTAPAGTGTATGGIANVEDAVGGSGDDILVGSSEINALNGGDGADLIFGREAEDSLSGEAGNDSLIGGPGSDQVSGGDDDDQLVWNNGDGSDVMDGDAGFDTVKVTGSDGTTGDQFEITANVARIAFDRVNFGNFNLDIGTTENLNILPGSGDDSITIGDLTGVTDLQGGQLFGRNDNDLIDLTNQVDATFTFDLVGGAQDDTLNGSPNSELLDAQDGNDSVVGFQGDDTIMLGSGDDLNTWNNGDGSDLIDGGDGDDTQQVNGNETLGDNFVIQDGMMDPMRVDFQRLDGGMGLGPFALDIGTVENLDLNSLGGDDTITAMDLSTGLIGLDLAGGDDNDQITGSVDADVIDAGAGNDNVVAFQGDDTIMLGAGDDTNTWNNGDGSDLIDGGDGDDLQQVNGNMMLGDNFQIQDGMMDPMRVDFQRLDGGMGLGPFTLDIGTVETLDLNSLGGDDTIAAMGLSSGLIGLDLESGDDNDQITGSAGADVIDAGAGDDSVVGFQGDDTIMLGSGDDLNTWNNGDGSDLIDGGDGDDTQQVNGNETLGDNFVIQDGMMDPMRVDFQRLDGGMGLGPFALDIGTVENLDLNSLGGDDTITAMDLSTGLIGLDLAGGDDNDQITGSVDADVIDAGAGNDNVVAFQGDDTIMLGAGDDTNTWNNGDGSDLIDGNDGDDTQVVNGNPTEGDTFQIQENPSDASRVDFQRLDGGMGLGAFTLDIGTTETLELNSLGGDDTITATLVEAGLIGLVLNSGDDDDSIRAGQGPDRIDAGAGDDSVIGFIGDDTIMLGSGDDQNTWNNGDGSDLIDGGDGDDIQRVNGNNTAGDTFEVAPNAMDSSRFLLQRIAGGSGLGPFSLDVGTVEMLQLATLGGNDTITAAPSTVTEYEVDGGTGTDSLLVNTSGTTNPMIVGPDDTGSGEATFGNRMDIRFSNIESVTEVTSTVPTGQNTNGLIAVGAGVAGTSDVTVRNVAGSITQTISQPFTSTEAPNGTRTAYAQVTGDDTPDVIIGTGPGARTQVLIFDGASGNLVQTILPFESTFTGGVFVAAGDINLDGLAEVVITPDEGGGPVVAIYNGGTFAELQRFFGIEDPNFRGGARASLGDINSNGISDVMVAAGFGGGPRVALFSGATVLDPLTGTTLPPKLVNDFFVFEPTLRNGVFPAVGDWTGDGFADVFVGGGPGGGPRVFGLSGADLVNGTQTQVANFFAGDPNNRGGIRLVFKEIEGDQFADIVTASGTDTSPQVTTYAGIDAPPDGLPTELGSFTPFATSFTGGVFVG